MHIAVYNRSFDIEDLPIFLHLLKSFEDHDIVPVIYEPLYLQLKLQYHFQKKFELFSETYPLSTKTKFVFSMGGDGTMLDIVKFVADKKIPILGINLGRLGFLSATHVDDIDFAINSLLKDSYMLDPRSLIHLDSNVNLFSDAPFALNEFSLHRKDSSSLIKIHTYLNGEFLCTYWADGLMVSTPTGSTGYSLSCGGPIIFPQASSFVITPVAPHNLNVRPIVVADNSIITFEVEGRAEQFLCTLDARSEAIDSSVSLAVRKENFMINLIRLEGQNFLNTLQTKLYWGVDRRN
ncbi:MAG: NAD kinase [Bacteroidetes bacterium]|jgi:NAD+ kinase|nr:NAD kinase [Bacteroidota bacterium]HQW46399.1 NAD kinase [Chitinophagaceae bacterium]MBK6818286.1 NAD kinase [Bacteroidota bacterium]MBK7040496.1 NAD kinase [Bacteroidota bacterium]MBK7587167.1 NAD kinase [Bacteroidota bacterium]